MPALCTSSVVTCVELPVAGPSVPPVFKANAPGRHEAGVFTAFDLADIAAGTPGGGGRSTHVRIAFGKTLR
jgi:hypothetical protein